MLGGVVITRDRDGRIVKAESFASRSQRITRAVAAYARKHGMYARTVRAVSVHFRADLRDAGIV